MAPFGTYYSTVNTEDETVPLVPPAVSGETLLEALRGLDPDDVVPEVVDVPFRVGGKTVMIVHASCACGGSLAWMHLRETGAWEMKGCVCHNPALGV